MDMIFCQKARIDWGMVKLIRAEETLKNSKNKNKKRTPHNMSVDLVLIVKQADKRAKQCKLDCLTEGPYTIMRFFDRFSISIFDF